MKTIYLIRHGNTFNPGEKSYFVGAKEDLELTASGIKQAEQLSKTLPGVLNVYSGELKRQLQTATELASEPKITPALNEFDYGEIGGLTVEELSDKQSEAHSKWTNNGVWPYYIHETEAERVRALKELLEDVPDNSALVTSGGVLQLIFKMLSPESFSKEAKVRTGAYCILHYPEKIESWNIRPGD